MSQLGEYQRPTQTVELPSGKKVELVMFFSQEEMADIKGVMVKGKKIKGENLIKIEMAKKRGEEVSEMMLFEGMEFDLDDLNNASKFTRRLAIRKLIGEDGKEYNPSEEGIRSFFNEEDGAKLDEVLNAMHDKKKL